MVKPENVPIFAELELRVCEVNCGETYVAGYRFGQAVLVYPSGFFDRMSMIIPHE
jgi:hypothetical protein